MPAAIAGEEKYPYPASGLEKAIGYTFRNQELLLNALRHSSYSNETKKTQNASNERLEFLGDSVLSVIVSDYIYRNYANLDEGDLTKIRASVVCENSLAALAARLELGSYMYLGHGEIVTHGRNRKSIVADAFEALLAAIYLDGGIGSARKIIQKFILSREVAGLTKPRDYKTALQELVQRESGQVLAYQLVGEEGPDHDKRFVIELLINSNVIAVGEGRSKKQAEQAAARAALELMGE